MPISWTLEYARIAQWPVSVLIADIFPITKYFEYNLCPYLKGLVKGLNEVMDIKYTIDNILYMEAINKSDISDII